MSTITAAPYRTRPRRSTTRPRVSFPSAPRLQPRTPAAPGWSAARPAAHACRVSAPAPTLELPTLDLRGPAPVSWRITARGAALLTTLAITTTVLALLLVAGRFLAVTA